MNVHPLAERARLLMEQVKRTPDDCVLLNNLGTVLHEMGYRTAARTSYTEAVRQHPADPMSRVNLGNMLHEAGEYAAAREHYEAALEASPEFAEAHQGLSYVLAEL